MSGLGLGWVEPPPPPPRVSLVAALCLRARDNATAYNKEHDKEHHEHRRSHGSHGSNNSTVKVITDIHNDFDSIIASHWDRHQRKRQEQSMRHSATQEHARSGHGNIAQEHAMKIVPWRLKINVVEILKASTVSRDWGHNESPSFEDWYTINRTDSKDA